MSERRQQIHSDEENHDNAGSARTDDVHTLEIEADSAGSRETGDDDVEPASSLMSTMMKHLQWRHLLPVTWIFRKTYY